jgi:hypothetical protein
MHGKDEDAQRRFFVPYLRDEFDASVLAPSLASPTTSNPFVLCRICLSPSRTSV